MFGRYSESSTAGRRYTLADYRRYFPGATVSKAGHNRAWVVMENGDVAYVLHQTPVATFHLDGTVTLDDGGWATMTTRRAMTEAVVSRGITARVNGGGPKFRHVLFTGAYWHAWGTPVTRGYEREAQRPARIHVNLTTGEVVARDF